MSKVEVVLNRFPSTPEGTFGALTLQDKQLCFTLELPWKDNQPSISCIPEGEYEVTQRASPRFGPTYWVRGVPGRSYILIHAANLAGSVEDGWQSHLEGCIALGKGHGRTKNKYGAMQHCLFNSGAAVGEFTRLLDGQDFKLTIRSV